MYYAFSEGSSTVLISVNLYFLYQIFFHLFTSLELKLYHCLASKVTDSQSKWTQIDSLNS